MDPINLIEMLLVLVGAFAVFKEIRGLILLYIGIIAASTVLGIVYELDQATDEPKLGSRDTRGPPSEDQPDFLSTAIECLIGAVVSFFFLRVLLNLSKFIKDRETAQPLPVVYKAAPSAPEFD
ncbi:hypothetical protein PENTCL1PPCAC_22104 [Pristionchus entomophagus]|uniref:Uncharacterized protein n=1 Tax=Pristionchus entomophagus TaxID=358040 RepID=A0AAV5TZH2_9BILA|nr:hypothetical protein PENTCL1PPCAC_22104 [Pristionchus entomophagus]